MNTRDPRDPKDTRAGDTGYRDTRDTRYSNVEVRPDRSWLRWVIPAAIVALLLPFLFHRGHHEPEQGTAAIQQPETTHPDATTTQTPGTAATQPDTTAQHMAMAPTSVYVGSDSTLSDADKQKLSDVASTARQSGSGVAVSGSRSQADAVRQALISQGVPDSQIEIREAAAGGEDGRVDITSR